MGFGLSQPEGAWTKLKKMQASKVLLPRESGLADAVRDVDLLYLLVDPATVGSRKHVRGLVVTTTSSKTRVPTEFESEEL